MHGLRVSDVTRILSQIESGDPSAAEKLLPLVYDELCKLGEAKLAHEKPGQTLQATALVHEAYLRLMGNAGATSFAHQRHFFAAAADAMRRILVDQARRKLSVRHGGQWQRVGQLTELLGADSDAVVLPCAKHFEFKPDPSRGLLHRTNRPKQTARLL